MPPESEIVSPISDSDMNALLPGQKWVVDALWPRAKVTGTILNELTGENFRINGKGYRENSWGRYAMPLDGWDFLVFNAKTLGGVEFVLQSYHHSKKLDFLDITFMQEGRVKSSRFLAQKGELKWSHEKWEWDERARQCIPTDWRIEAQNSEIFFEAKGEMPLPSAQAPFLSNATLGTDVFFIQEQYPEIQGRIVNKSNSETVATFSDHFRVCRC